MKKTLGGRGQGIALNDVSQTQKDKAVCALICMRVKFLERVEWQSPGNLGLREMKMLAKGHIFSVAEKYICRR